MKNCCSYIGKSQPLLTRLSNLAMKEVSLSNIESQKSSSAEFFREVLSHGLVLKCFKKNYGAFDKSTWKKNERDLWHGKEYRFNQLILLFECIHEFL